MSIPRRASFWLTFCIISIFLLSACGGATSGTTPPSSTSSSSAAINVVAAENFYGDIVKQLGGNRVAVTSILSDPDIDPHEYTSNVPTALAV